jgi:hypothetical protein
MSGSVTDGQYLAPSKQTDTFAFGCAAYEIITDKPPHHELEKVVGNDRLVEQRYEQNRFPDVSDLPLGPLMQSCWQGESKSMAYIDDSSKRSGAST